MNRMTQMILGIDTDGVNNPKSLFRDEPLSVGSSSFQRSLIGARWEKVLAVEGFGFLNTKDNKVDVSNEVDNIFEFRKLTAFRNSTKDDINIRKILLAEYVKPYFSGKSLNHSIQVSDSFVNDIIDTIAVVYSSSPKRWIPDPIANEFINTVVESGNINTKLLEAHRLLKLCNNVAIKVVRRFADDESVIDIDVYDPTSYRLLYNNENELVKICYVGDIYHPNGSREEVIFVYTKTQHYYCNVEGERFAVEGNPDAVNPYGIIPFVVAQLKPSDVFGGYDADLIMRNLNHNFYKLLCNDDSVISTRHLTFLTNVLVPDNSIISSQDVFISEAKSADERPDASIISGQPHFSQLKDLYEAEKKTAALERGVPAYMVDNNFRELNSAKALVVQSKRLMDAVKADVPALKLVEKRLWKIISVIAGVEHKAKRYIIPKSFDLGLLANIQVDYPELLSGYTDMDKMQEWILLRQQVQSGVLSASDLVRYYNSDINTTEEALQTLRHNLKENEEFMDNGITTLFDMINTGDNDGNTI